MKSLKFLTCLTLSLASTAPALAAEGGGSHGGDMLVNEFTGTMDNLVKAIEKHQPAACAPGTDLRNMLEKVTVFGSPIVLVDFVEQDARSFAGPDPKTPTVLKNLKNTLEKRWIEINRGRLILPVDALRYLNLVLHEYYVHLGLEEWNQMILSKGCLDELAAERIDLASLLYRQERMTSIEEQLLAGRMILQCPAADGSTILLQYREVIPQQKDESARSQVTMILKGRNGVHQAVENFTIPNTVKRPALFFTYDLSTGVSKVSGYHLRWAANQASPRHMILMVETTDHMNWTVSYVQGHRKLPTDLKIQPFARMACTPVYYRW